MRIQTRVTCRCQRCEWEWFPRSTARSIMCPACHSRRWDQVDELTQLEKSFDKVMEAVAAGAGVDDAVKEHRALITVFRLGIDDPSLNDAQRYQRRMMRNSRR